MKFLASILLALLLAAAPASAQTIIAPPTASGGGGSTPVVTNLPMCQCVLTSGSATALTLSPLNGNYVFINGAYYQIPTAGITVANTGVFINGTSGQNLAAGTFYYVYVFSNAGTLALDFSTTGFATNASTGYPQKSADATRHLVGEVFMSSSAQFTDTRASRMVRSWYNRQAAGQRSLYANSTTTHYNGGGTPVEICPECRLQFIMLPGENFSAHGAGNVYNDTGGQYAVVTALSLDSSTALTDNNAVAVYYTSATPAATNIASSSLSANAYHTVYTLGWVSGGTGYWVISTGYGMAWAVYGEIY